MNGCVEVAGVASKAPTSAASRSAEIEPYIGLRPYREDEKDRFFGRERDAELLINKIFANTLTLLYAPSGVGKTSLLQTLVIPGLREDEAHVVYFDNWAQADPYLALKNRLLESVGVSEADFAQTAEVELSEVLKSVHQKTERTMVLILDQFEEFLQRHTSRLDPLREKLGAAVRAKLDLRVVLSFREEFLASVDACFRYQILTLFGSTYHLEHLDEKEATQAIVGPAGMYGVSYEKPLVEALLRDLQPRAYKTADSRSILNRAGIELPFLQIICSRLWQEVWNKEAGKARIQELTLTLYQNNLGGREGIIGVYLRTVTAGLSVRQKLAAAKLFSWLAPRSGMKVAFPLDVLQKQTRLSSNRVQKILEHLQKHHIVRTRETSGGVSYELYHDAFISILQPWYTARLKWQRFWNILAATVVILFLSAVIAQPFYHDWRQQLATTKSDRMAREAELLIAAQPMEALRLAREAHSISATPRAEYVLRRTLAPPRELPISPAHNGPAISGAASREKVVTAGQDGTAYLWDVASGARQTLKTDEERVTAVAFSPDGEKFVTGNEQGAAHIWDTSTGTRKALPGHEGRVNSVTFNHDGTRTLIASEDGYARLYDAAGKLFWEFPHLEDDASAAFTLHGDRVVTTSFYGANARILDAGTGQEIIELKDVFTLASSLGGKRFFTFDPEGKARVWHAESGESTDGGRSTPLRPLDWAILSPDNTLLVTTFRDQSPIVWDADTLQIKAELKGHRDGVTQMAFSSDGRLIVTTGRDKIVRVSDSHNGKTVAEFPGHPYGNTTWAAFGQDGNWVATAGEDGSVGFWEIRSGAIVAIPEKPDGAARAREAETKKLIGSLGPNEDRDLRNRDKDLRTTTTSAAYGRGRNRALFVTGDRDGTARAWDMANTERPVAAHRFGRDSLSDIAFSKDGEFVVTASKGGTVHIWKWEDEGTQPVDLKSGSGALQNAAFSADGKMVVTVAVDGTTEIWNRSDGKEMSELRGESGRIDSAAFSEDGKRVFAWSRDTVLIFQCQFWCQESSEILRLAEERLGERLQP